MPHGKHQQMASIPLQYLFRSYYLSTVDNRAQLWKNISRIISVAVAIKVHEKKKK